MARMKRARAKRPPTQVTTVRVAPELWWRVRVLAVHSRRTMRQILEQALVAYLEWSWQGRGPGGGPEMKEAEKPRSREAEKPRSREAEKPSERRRRRSSGFSAQKYKVNDAKDDPAYPELSLEADLCEALYQKVLHCVKWPDSPLFAYGAYGMNPGAIASNLPVQLPVDPCPAEHRLELERECVYA